MQVIARFISASQLARISLGALLMFSGSAALSENVGSSTPASKVLLDSLYKCDASNAKPARLQASKPVAVLVHGLNGSPAMLSSFARALEDSGMQTLCFTYGGRASLRRVAGDLARGLESIAEQLHAPKITLIGHSMGGLVARKALVIEAEEPIDVDAEIRLVTVASPFSGIRKASPCGYLSLRIASLGLQDLACWIVSGNKWNQITPSSSFIQQPGTLHPVVKSFLLVKTDETGSCRTYRKDNTCLLDDFVIRPSEQVLPEVEKGRQAQQIVLQAGHAAVVGQGDAQPFALIEALTRKGLLTNPDMRLAGRTVSEDADVEEGTLL